MKPVDFRNATYRELLADLDSRRLEAFSAWSWHGPGTTREVSTRSGMDILSLRPRTTELIDMGLLRLSDHQPSRTEGRYEVATKEQWEAFRAEKIGNQMEMAI